MHVLRLFCQNFLAVSLFQFFPQPLYTSILDIAIKYSAECRKAEIAMVDTVFVEKESNRKKNQTIAYNHSKQDEVA